MIKEFFLKKMLLAKGVPESQIEMIMTMMEKDPELFKKITTEIQAAMKSGKTEMQAMFEVMPKYKDRLQQILQK